MSHAKRRSLMAMIWLMGYILTSTAFAAPIRDNPSPSVLTDKMDTAKKRPMATPKKSFVASNQFANLNQKAINKKQGGPSKPAPRTQTAKGTAHHITSWEISGAMAAKSKGRAWNASMNWQQYGMNGYQIRLFGPFGSGSILIQKRGGVIVFKDGPKSFTSRDASRLLAQQTGIHIPVSNLYYWARGLPAPGGSSITRDANGYIRVLRQSGYLIEYQQYTLVNGIALPTQIRLQGNQVFIKLVIKRWRIS